VGTGRVARTRRARAGTGAGRRGAHRPDETDRRDVTDDNRKGSERRTGTTSARNTTRRGQAHTSSLEMCHTPKPDRRQREQTPRRAHDSGGTHRTWNQAGRDSSPSHDWRPWTARNSQHMADSVMTTMYQAAAYSCENTPTSTDRQQPRHRRRTASRARQRRQRRQRPARRRAARLACIATDANWPDWERVTCELGGLARELCRLDSETNNNWGKKRSKAGPTGQEPASTSWAKYPGVVRSEVRGVLW
jgi:hypothetical protein